MNSSSEKTRVAAIASLFSFRMLGLFMILPVFSVYATELSGSTSLLIGVAIGAYGLTQAICQIPFGFLSDRIGRKPVITFGLILFALGSVVAALSHSIYMMILGRALQGTGAIGSTLIASLADSTREENRTRAMAVIGMVIGLSFMLAMVLGSWLNRYIGVPGIFWFTAILATTGIAIAILAIPSTERRSTDSTPVPALFKSVLRHAELLRLDIGIFCQHAILTASFMVIPLTFHDHPLYLPIFIGSFLLMFPFIYFAEKKQQQKRVFLGAIATVIISQLALSYRHDQLWIIITELTIFFAAFNLLEATLPSMISKLAPPNARGTAMGIYSTSQFLGIFFGGTLGGWLYQYYSITGVFFGCAIVGLIWLLIASGMRYNPSPTYKTNR